MIALILVYVMTLHALTKTLGESLGVRIISGLAESFDHNSRNLCLAETVLFYKFKDSSRSENLKQIYTIQKK